MATMLDRVREGLIWSYAVLTLAEERQATRRKWWEQERIRLKEEARAHLDAALREMEEHRAQRRDRIRQRIRDRLGTGIATTDDVAALESKIDELVTRLDRLYAHGSSDTAAEAAMAESAPPAPDTPPAS